MPIYHVSVLPSIVMVVVTHQKKPRISTCQLLVPPNHSLHSILKRQRKGEVRDKERKNEEGEGEQIMKGREGEGRKEEEGRLEEK